MRATSALATLGFAGLLVVAACSRNEPDEDVGLSKQAFGRSGKHHGKHHSRRGCWHGCPEGERCSHGRCVAVCGPGTNNCDGVCRDLAIDPRNCGACDRACDTGETCLDGACAPANCDCAAPFTSCGDVCINTSVDPNHCGACGNVCPTPDFALAACAGGQCGFICQPNHGDCDGLQQNGCETDLSSPVACGACGSVCSFAFATGVCVNGDCQLEACLAGRGDCNLTAEDGCEVDFNVDAMNCGACGNVCDAGDSCVAGACVGGTPPSADGVYGLNSSISYTCCGGLVDVDIDEFIFAGGGATILSSPSNPVPLHGSPTSPPAGSFDASGVIPGGCTETYRLAGSFTGPDSWFGAYSIDFTGPDCSCFGGTLGTPCVSQTFLRSGTRSGP